MSYSDVIFPRQHRVAGWRLKPFTLGHALLLQSLRSPLPPIPAEMPIPAAEGAEGVEGLPLQSASGDLALGIWACRRSWRRARSLLDSRLARLELRCLIWAVSGDAFEPAWAQWIAYAAAARQSPEVWSSAGDNILRLEAPVTLTLHLRLMREMGCTPDSALDVPLQQALWWSLGRSEQEGLVRWESPDMAAAKRAALSAATGRRN